jgi:hypothetical protein
MDSSAVWLSRTTDKADLPSGKQKAGDKTRLEISPQRSACFAADGGACMFGRRSERDGPAG